MYSVGHDPLGPLRPEHIFIGIDHVLGAEDGPCYERRDVGFLRRECRLNIL